jgi:hypothetical protein
MKLIERLAAVGLSIMVIGLLARCGTPVCVISFGDCSLYNNWAGGAGSGTPTANNLVFTNIPTNNIIIWGETVKLTITGGTSPYAFTQSPQLFPTNQFTQSGADLTVVAPSQSGTVTITCTDANNLVQNLTLTVQQTH